MTDTNHCNHCGELIPVNENPVMYGAEGEKKPYCPNGTSSHLEHLPGIVRSDCVSNFLDVS